MTRLNEFGQPVGDPVEWSAATFPPAVALAGRHVALEPMAPQHAQAVVDRLAPYPDLWTYQAEDAPASVDEAAAVISAAVAAPDTVPYAIVDRPGGELLGRVSYLRIQPRLGSIEVGGIIYGPGLQRTTGATEVQHLLMRHAFDDLGYRRYEWKCDSLNAPSRSAALRLGFVEEGTWRNALIYKGRNRDTTWFSVTDAEWPTVGAAFEEWLADANRDASGQQRRSLAEIRTALRAG